MADDIAAAQIERVHPTANARHLNEGGATCINCLLQAEVDDTAAPRQTARQFVPAHVKALVARPRVVLKVHLYRRSGVADVQDGRDGGEAVEGVNVERVYADAVGSHRLIAGGGAVVPDVVVVGREGACHAVNRPAGDGRLVAGKTAVLDGQRTAFEVEATAALAGDIAVQGVVPEYGRASAANVNGRAIYRFVRFQQHIGAVQRAFHKDSAAIYRSCIVAES